MSFSWNKTWRNYKFSWNSCRGCMTYLWRMAVAMVRSLVSIKESSPVLLLKWANRNGWLESLWRCPKRYEMRSPCTWKSQACRPHTCWKPLVIVLLALIWLPTAQNYCSAPGSGSSGQGCWASEAKQEAGNEAMGQARHSPAAGARLSCYKPPLVASSECHIYLWCSCNNAVRNKTRILLLRLVSFEAISCL